jgi:hypothetical protein
MKIPSKTLKRWLELKEEGDIALLATLIGKSEATVYKILSSGETKVEHAEKINDFYKERKKRTESIKIEDENN